MNRKEFFVTNINELRILYYSAIRRRRLREEVRIRFRFRPFTSTVLVVSLRSFGEDGKSQASGLLVLQGEDRFEE